MVAYLGNTLQMKKIEDAVSWLTSYGS